ncbi:MAG: AraC family transcriptional regulator [Chitinophagaceae bacterium]
MKTYFHKVSNPIQRSFVVRHDIVPNFGKPVHYHTELELHLTLRGEGIRFIGDNVAAFSPGEILLLGEDLPHAWHAREKEVPDVEAIVIQFKKGCLGNDFFSLPELLHIQQLYDIAKKGLLLHGTCRDKVEVLMHQGVDATDFQRVLLLLEMLNLIAVSKEYTTVSATEVSYKGDAEDVRRLDKIYAYTLANFKEEITLSEIAAVAHLSETSFCRYFKSTTRNTYFDFLIQVRVNFACQMIVEDKYSIAAICYECGFNNVSNFYRHFKKVMGMTPAEYKKKYVTDDAAA